MWKPLTVETSYNLWRNLWRRWTLNRPSLVVRRVSVHSTELLAKGISGKLLLSQSALFKLTEEPQGRILHPHRSLNTVKLSCWPHWGLILYSNLFRMAKYSAGYQNRKVDTNPTTKLLTYIQSYMQNMLGHRTCVVANQCLIWLNFCDKGTHTQHCLCNQEPETRYPRDLVLNHTWLAYTKLKYQ